MYKLGALDAGFLYNETDRCPQHIASVQILELPTGVTPQGYVDDLKSVLLQRIHLVPYFTNRLQMVPFHLDHPVWVADERFDINHHVRSVEISAPGSRSEFEAAIAGLHEQRLDRSRPLWDIWILTGLEGGRVACYNRVHHACLDGMAGQVMLQTIMDVTEQPRDVEPAPVDFVKRDDRQNTAQLLTGALENFARFQSKQPLAMVNALETAARLFQRTFDPRKGFGAAAMGAPRTRFNGSVERERRFATGEIDITAVKALAKASETKINDIFLAACAGGLRRYLDRNGQLPSDSLVAGAPVSVRKPGDGAANNQVTMMLVNLATAESDPRVRLQAIAASAMTAKGLTADLSGSFDAEVSIPGMPGMLRSAALLADSARLTDLPVPRIPCNVVVSNVPGPQQQLYLAGARVLTHYPVSIPAHGQAVNITVQSYAGMLYFAITACARALPDADRLRDDILAGFEELLDVSGIESAAPAETQLRSENGAAQKIPGRNGAMKRQNIADDRQVEAA